MSGLILLFLGEFAVEWLLRRVNRRQSEVCFSPDVILRGWLGSKYQVTNSSQWHMLWNLFSNLMFNETNQIILIFFFFFAPIFICLLLIFVVRWLCLRFSIVVQDVCFCIYGAIVLCSLLLKLEGHHCHWWWVSYVMTLIVLFVLFMCYGNGLCA